jgi:integrase
MLRHKEAEGRRKRAVDAIAGNLDKHVEPFFGASRDVRTLRRSDLEAFKRHLHGQGKAPVTINNNLAAIRAVLKHAWAVEELIELVPNVPNVRVPNESKGRALTPDQIVALINAVDPRATEAREWLLFLANTGLRKGEALAVEWAWIDWEARTLAIPAEFRKGARRQIAPVPLNDVAIALLRKRQRRKAQPKYGRVWWQQKHDGARNSAAARAGLGRVRNHDLRHSFGSLAHAAGASLPDVRDLLGHTTLAMVSRYAHSYQARLADVANKVQVGVSGAVTGKGSKMRPKGRKWTRAAGGAKVKR